MLELGSVLAVTALAAERMLALSVEVVVLVPPTLALEVVVPVNGSVGGSAGIPSFDVKIAGTNPGASTNTVTGRIFHSH